MKTFKSFLGDRLNELNLVKPKAKGEQSFVKATYQAQIKDPGDLEDVGPEEIGPKGVKSGSGKRPADRLDNKQPFGEADMSKAQTKMAHTIGKHFEKKGVGDKSKGGPYAVATAMVQDKPAAAEKAYKTIKAKAKNEEHELLLIALYDELHENNKDALLEKLDEDYDRLIEFAKSVAEE